MNPIRQGAAIALASGVAVASLAGPSAAAAAHHKPPTTNASAAAAAGYLARHLAGKHHDHYIDSFVVKGKTFHSADDGETADAVLSMDAAGVAQTAAKRATKWLESDAKNYLSAGGFTTAYYPGQAGKLLLVANAQHVNPEHFGGIDLVGVIVGSEGAGTGTAVGQYQNADDTAFGSSVTLQSLALLGLAGAAGVAGPDDAAQAFLAGQACSDGGFQNDIRKSGGCSTEDVDATSYAVQALVATNDKAAISPAVHWLTSKENHNGGWGETPGTAPDANTTALAVEALLAAHRSAAKGERWLRSQQLTCASRAANRGAVRFQGKHSDAAGDLRATTQSGAALALRPFSWIDRSGAASAAPVLRCPKH